MTECPCGWTRGKQNDPGLHLTHMNHLVEAERQKQIAAGYPQFPTVPPVPDPAEAGPRKAVIPNHVTVWLARDRFGKHLTLSTVPFTRELFPAGPEGDGWEIRRLDVTGTAWHEHLRGGDHRAAAEVRTHRLSWWDAATPEIKD